MPDSTTQTPNIPSGTELYDQVMGAIEPELVSAKLSSLKEVFAAGSKEENNERAQRYAAAFKVFPEALAQKKQELGEEVKHFADDTLRIAEDFASAMESESMSTLENDIFNTDQ